MFYTYNYTVNPVIMQEAGENIFMKRYIYCILGFCPKCSPVQKNKFARLSGTELVYVKA